VAAPQVDAAPFFGSFPQGTRQEQVPRKMPTAHEMRERQRKQLLGETNKMLRLAHLHL
jgi:hypothetical protein